MGGAKREWERAQDRGWTSIDRFVCTDCVELVEFKEIIENNLVSESCDYCDRTDAVPIAAPVDDLLEVLFETIHTYYASPEEAGVPYDGGPIIESWYLGDVLDSLGFGGEQTLIDDIIQADMIGSWVPAAEGHWLAEHEHQSLLYSWSRFARLVKHVTRYHFGSVEPADDLDPFEIDPRSMLQVLGRHLQALVCTIPAGTEVFRIRRCKRADTWFPDATTMGAPPSPSSGRMNPAGISYLYTSFDSETALHEVGAHKRITDRIYVACFKLTSSIQVVDLTRLPLPPSIFEVDKKQDREKWLFAQKFADEISTPVTKNGQEHIDYVPSQVVCEYLAQVFEPHSGGVLAGLIYPSAVYDGGRNLVVFPSNRGWGLEFHGVCFERAYRYRKARGAASRWLNEPYPPGRLEPL